MIEIRETAGPGSLTGARLDAPQGSGLGFAWFAALAPMLQSIMPGMTGQAAQAGTSAFVQQMVVEEAARQRARTMTTVVVGGIAVAGIGAALYFVLRD